MEMHISFTGTQTLLPQKRRFVDPVLCALVPSYQDATGWRFVTGACIGVDAYVGRRLVDLYPEANHEVLVPFKRGKVDEWWPPYVALGYSITVIEMPADTDFRYRNTKLVERGNDLLVPFPEYGEDDGRSKRSGTWMTVRIARAKDVRLYPYTYVGVQ